MKLTKAFFTLAAALLLSPVFYSCAGDRGNDTVESEAKEAELVEAIDQTMTEQAQEETEGEVAGDMIAPEENN